VVLKSVFNFGKNGRGYTFVTCRDYRFKAVRVAAEKFFLAFC
jgi:hypothetical protein